MLKELEDIGIEIDLLKIFFISICTYYTFFKIMNIKKSFDIKSIISFLAIFIISIIVNVIKYKINFFIAIVVLDLFLSFLCSIITKINIGYTMLIIGISLSINYVIFCISIIIMFVPNIIFKNMLSNDLLNLVLIEIIHVGILNMITKIKRFKYGIAALQKNSKNNNIDICILSISTCILISVTMLYHRELLVTRSILIEFIIFAIFMVITIQKSLNLSYKQKLLVQELNETKEELENTKKELKQVEEENLKFSKKSHTLAHRQKSLEHKIQELVTKAEISTEEAGEVKYRLKEIEKDLYKETATVELSKTEISEIDDMLKYMQSECIKNKIEFELQLAGNIHYMTNNLISKEDLEILLADHIKDAIIAVNHTDNINRSILVRLGEIDGVYSLYIYDSGIEFEIETLKNLGKKPSTTHADEGGTGMGFMNTFDTLRKYKASLTINELSKPNKDNYTKVLIFKFDKKNEFKIISYRQEELN